MLFKNSSGENNKKFKPFGNGNKYEKILMKSCFPGTPEIKK
jgi:hypothetical protein